MLASLASVIVHSSLALFTYEFGVATLLTQRNYNRGGITVLLSAFGYYWLPSSPQNARWFTPAEKEVAKARALRDGSKVVDEKFSLKLAFQQWKNPKMILWSLIALTYPIPFTTSANFLPQVRRYLHFYFLYLFPFKDFYGLI